MGTLQKLSECSTGKNPQLHGSSVVKNLPAMQGTRVRSLGQDDPLEKEMGTHSCILAWEITWTEELGRLQRFRHDSATKRQQHNLHTIIVMILKCKI